MCGHIQLQGVVGDPVRAPLVDVVINPCNGPDFISKAVGTEGIHIRCGVVSLVAVDHNVILTTDVIEALSQIYPVASVCNMPVCVDEVNEYDDSCEVNDVDVDDGDECQGAFTMWMILCHQIL